jgi:hypothetical protein
MGRGNESAAEVISPGMIRALDGRRKGTGSLRAQSGAPVSAHVIEGVELILFVSDDDQTLAADFTNHEISPLGYLVGPTRVKPHAKKEALELGAVVVQVGVVTCR